MFGAPPLRYVRRTAVWAGPIAKRASVMLIIAEKTRVPMDGKGPPQDERQVWRLDRGRVSRWKPVSGTTRTR